MNFMERVDALLSQQRPQFTFSQVLTLKMGPNQLAFVNQNHRSALERKPGLPTHL